MGILDTLLDSSKKSQTIKAQAKQIDKLEKAVKDSNFKAEAALDLEFSQYRQDSRFIDLIK